jgi:phosphoglucosamine mutase
MKYFGTDGIRGRVGEKFMTPDFALRLANASAQVLAPKGGTVLIGKDTRISGYMFESALEAGFVSAGINVKLLGPIPTPAIAYLIRRYNAELGIVISASHNSFKDNGIKFFNSNGTKLDDESEVKIEAALEESIKTKKSTDLGRATIDSLARERYQEFCISTYDANETLTEMKVIFDGANGAGYKVGPRTLNDLGAQVLSIGCSPNGQNINDNCGSTHPELLQQTVTAVGADVGIALDGDGDRVIMVDENGELLDGDQLLFILAMDFKSRDKLRTPVVGTVLSNIGLEIALKDNGIDFTRSKVGDRNILKLLREKGGNLGGEASGHMICMDYAETGDGLITAIQILAIMRRNNETLSSLSNKMKKHPQVIENIDNLNNFNIHESDKIKQLVTNLENTLDGKGRVILRPSGTEPLIRLMLEGEDIDHLKTQMKEFRAKVEEIVN